MGGEECRGRRPRRELGFLSCDPSPRLPHSLAWRPGSGSEEGLLPARVPLSPGELAAQLEEAAEREGQMRPKGCWHWGTGWFRVTAQVAEGSPRPLPKAGAGATPLSGHRTDDRRGSQHAGCRVTQDAGSWEPLASGQGRLPEGEERALSVTKGWLRRPEATGGGAGQALGPCALALAVRVPSLCVL